MAASWAAVALPGYGSSSTEGLPLGGLGARVDAIQVLLARAEVRHIASPGRKGWMFRGDFTARGIPALIEGGAALHVSAHVFHRTSTS